MAGLPDGYYTNKIKKFNLDRVEGGLKITLNFTPLGIKLDRAQDILDAQVWNDVQKYMPLDTGTLKSQTNALNQTVRGRVYLYPPESDYGHYQYEGVVYVDPVYNKAAFYTPEYGFWSRPGVEKIPSDRKLTYSQPNATAHWGETAYQNHNQEWVEIVKRALQ